MLSSITRVLLFFTALAVPLTVLKPFTVGPFIFSVSKTVTTGLLLWMPVVWVASRRPYPKDRKFPWLVAFTFAIAVSLVTSFLEGVAAITSVIIFTTYAAIALFYVLIVYLVTDLAAVRAVVLGYVVGTGFASVSVLLGFSVKASVYDRTGGLGGDPNHFAYDAAIGICFAAIIYLTFRSRLLRFASMGAGLMGLAGIIASISRSGFVTVVAIFALWMVRFRRFNVLVYVVPALMIGAVGMFTVSDAWRERMSTMLTAESRADDGSIESRYVGGGLALRAFAANPVTGVGFLRFGDWATERLRSERQSGRSGGSGGASGHMYSGVAVHNSYLLGIVPYLGLLGFSWFDFSRAWLFARRRMDDPEMRELYYVAIFFQLALFGALVDNLFLSSLRYKSIWLLMGLSTAVLTLVRRRAAQLSSEADVAPEISSPLGSIPGLPSAEPGFQTRNF